MSFKYTFSVCCIARLIRDSTRDQARNRNLLNTFIANTSRYTTMHISRESRKTVNVFYSDFFFSVLPQEITVYTMLKRWYWRHNTMEFLIKVCIRLIQIVYKIIEGVIRSLLEVMIPIVFGFVAVSLCIIGLILITRWILLL